MVLYQVVSITFLLSFFACCVGSAILQVLAWNRHVKVGEAPTVRALWRPEAFLDEVGVRQMRLARLLLIIGMVAYLSLGVLKILAGVLFRDAG